METVFTGILKIDCSFLGCIERIKSVYTHNLTKIKSFKCGQNWLMFARIGK